VYVAEYFQLVQGAAALSAGLRMLPMMGMPLLVTPLSGLLADRVGARVLIATGLLTEGTGLVWFALRAGTATPYGRLAVPLVLIGAGLAMALMTTPTAALGAVPPAQLGTASGVNGTLTRFGGAFGVAVTTAVFAASGPAGTAAAPATGIQAAAGIRAALLVAAGLAGLGALTGLAIGRPRPTGPDRLADHGRPPPRSGVHPSTILTPAVSPAQGSGPSR
jgi:MFS family permease